MKKRSLILFVSTVIALSACTTTQGNSSSYSSGLSSEESSSSESIEIYSDDPSKERTDDSIPYSTVVSNGLEETTLSEVLTKFKKSSYGYYGGTFNKKMDEPTSTVTTHEELVNLFDYCAFYRIKDKNININFGTDKLRECNLAIWDSTLIPGTVGTVFKENEDGTVKAEFKYVDEANSFIPRDILGDLNLAYFPYIYDYKDENKPLIDSVPYVGNTELDVHNSDQLIYATTHGYKPVMASDSPAKKIYDKAVSILKSIIYKDMNDNEKLLAIEFYLNNTSEYDYVSDDSAAFISANHKSNPEEIAALFSGFYAEGVLFNGGSVCYGYAKAQALLSSLLGFQVKLTHGKMYCDSSETNDPVDTVEGSGNSYNAHGISLVRKDENSQWGICDPTYRFAGSQYGVDMDLVQFKRYPAVMLSYSKWKETYRDADEVAFKYMTVNDLVRESYNFVDDYRLVGGYKLNPRTQSEAKNAINGVFETIKKAKTLLNRTSKSYYCIAFYPESQSDDETIRLASIYEQALMSSDLYNTEMRYLYFGRQGQTQYFNLYGFSFIVKY